jgi:hypothetical protein
MQVTVPRSIKPLICRPRHKLSLVISIEPSQGQKVMLDFGSGESRGTSMS